MTVYQYELIKEKIKVNDGLGPKMDVLEGPTYTLNSTGTDMYNVILGLNLIKFFILKNQQLHE
jgi:hypothetical protein